MQMDQEYEIWFMGNITDMNNKNVYFLKRKCLIKYFSHITTIFPPRQSHWPCKDKSNDKMNKPMISSF